MKLPRPQPDTGPVKIAFITCYYGVERHVKMTESWYAGLLESIEFAKEQHDNIICDVFVLNNGSSRHADLSDCFWHYHAEENLGFSNGMGAGITAAHEAGYDWYCILNNDLIFEQKDWFSVLVGYVKKGKGKGRQTYLPLTTGTNRQAFRSEGPLPDHPKSLDFGPCPAVCWFMPAHQVDFLFDHYGIPVFHPDFKIGWYEDALTEKMLWAHYKNPFLIIYQSWVYHRTSATSNDAELFGPNFGYRDENQGIYLVLMKEYGLHETNMVNKDPFYL